MPDLLHEVEALQKSVRLGNREIPRLRRVMREMLCVVRCTQHEAKVVRIMKRAGVALVEKRP